MRKILICLVVVALSCNFSDKKNDFSIPAEFEEQEYIWLTWVETGFLGGDPFYYAALKAMKELTPYVKVKLFFGPQLSYNREQIEKRILSKLTEHSIDTSRITLFYNDRPYGAIQDPGPIFLKNNNGEFEIADFRYSHPDTSVEAMDRKIAARLNLPIISSQMFSEGGAWQTNGKGTMLLVESVELDRNPKMSKIQIEDEYKRMLGIKKVIWLKKGLKEEEWGKLENGIYGIGTGGHIDEFCRFVNEHTILLAEVSKAEASKDQISMESYERMEENFKILKNESDQDGNPFRIVRIPVAEMMTRKAEYKTLSNVEKSWFNDVTKDSVEFYLANSYLNFVIANGVVVTQKYWKEGGSEESKLKDEEARKIFEQVFPYRKIVQIDCMPLHYDGGGLHCHSKNQPK